MNSTLLQAIDNYCERTGPELWSEPLNALTNLAFIAAGIWGLILVRGNRTGSFAALLAWMAVLIGLGSGLFHTWANGLTKWGDIIPIALFVFTFTLFVLRRFLGFGWAVSVVLFVAFYAAAGFLTYLVPPWLVVATNGSSGYLPAFLAMLVFGLWVSARGHPAGKYMLAGAGIFVASVTFRIIDPNVCESMPIGTHFLWHTLNGLLLGVLLTAAALHGHAQAQAPNSFGRGSFRQPA